MERGCLEPDEVLAYLSEARVRTDAIAVHIGECDACRQLIAELARSSLLDDVSVPEQPPPPIGEFLPPGLAVGRYVLGKRLGAGGMGAVYEAKDPVLGRRVAIKLLRHAIADVAKRQLVAEAHAMARLAHPHVRTVFDIGEVDDRVFVALELIEGPTLAHWLMLQARSTDHILAVFVAAARGLAAAHAIGITHRDFKPSNAFVAANDRVLVSDFGLAAHDEQTAPMGGTPRYMAPEQRDGRGDARVDQYAFGIALTEALEKRRVPRRVQRALARCVDPDPERRFASMVDLVAALEFRRARSRTWIAGAIAGPLLVASALLGGSPAIAPPDAIAAPSSDPIDADVHRLDKQARALFRDGDYQASHDIAQQALDLATRRGNEPGRAVALLERGRALERLGRIAEADRDQEAAYMVAISAAREDLAAEAATARVTLLSSARGRHDEAILWGRHARAALGRSTEHAGDRARLDLALGTAYATRGDWAQAAAQTTLAIDYARAAGDRERWMLAVALGNRGHFFGQAGQLEASLRDLQEALALAIDHFGDEHTEVARLRVNLGNTHKLRGDHVQARALYEASLRTLQAEQGSDNPMVGVVLVALGATWIDGGEPMRALDPLDRAAAILGSEHPDAVHAHHNRAVALRDLGRCAEAREEAGRAIEIVTELLGPEHPSIVASQRLREECLPPPDRAAAHQVEPRRR